MKNVLTIIAALSIIFLSGCGSVEWTDETTSEFKKQCLGQMAKQFKAEDPDAFCDCFVEKIKEEEMGMMNIMKNAAKLAEDCGANIGGNTKEITE